jgi:type I restriction enzyme S subunit
MELKPGYKQTEVGVIPEEWDCVRIGDVAETSSGATPARSKQQDYFDGGVIPWVKTLDLNNSLILNSDECVTAKALQVTSLRIYPKESVLVAMYGGFNQIGRTGLLAMDATINQALTAIRPASSKLSSRYLLCYLNFRVEYWKSVASSSRKDPNITGKDVRDFPLPLPPLKEQESIGEALQHIDDYIHSLVALISKKDQLKQAAMQELLTGKRRLPGFEGEWVAGKLGDYVEKIVGGGTPSRANPGFWGGEIPWATVKDLTIFQPNQTQEWLTRDGLKNSSANLIPAGTLIASTRMALGKAVIFATDVAINQDLKAIFFGKNGMARFFCYWFEANASAIDAIGGGSTVKGISLSQLKALDVANPGLAEQNAIVDVISDIETEIETLENRLTKTRALKQAMMQELLTGRIRLR